MKIKRKTEYLYLVSVVTAMDDVPLMITASPQAARGKAVGVKMPEIEEALIKANFPGAMLFNTSVTVFKYVGTMAWPIKSTPYENKHIEAHNESLAQKSKMKIRRKKK